MPLIRLLHLVLMLTLLMPLAAQAADSMPPIVEGQRIERLEEVLKGLVGTGPLSAVAWSPDGKRLASSSDNRTIRLWNAESGREIKRLDGHSSLVTSIAWSPDGKRLASASYDKTIRLWDTGSGREIKRLDGHGSVVRSVAWSSDGKHLASASDDRTLRLWDAESGREFKRLEGHGGSVKSVAWSSDGKRLASASDDRTLRLWDAESGREFKRLEGHDSWIISVVWSPDDRRLASASYDNTLRLWDAESGHEIKRLDGHGGWIRSVTWSPDGKRLASASDDRTLRLWDAESGREIKRLDDHGNSVRSAAWSPDGKRLASASNDNTIRLWDAESGHEIKRLDGHGSAVFSVAWSPGSKSLASASDDKTIRLWDAGSGHENKRLDGHDGSVRFVAWSTDGKRLVSASDDKTIRLWDTGSGREIKRLDGHDGSVRFVAWSPDGNRLASASDDKTIRLWDIGSGREIKRLDGHGDWVRSVAWSPNGQRLASVSDDKTIRLWDAGSGREIRRLEGHGGWIRSVAWSLDGKILASASDDNTIRLWDAGSGREIKRLQGHSNPVSFVAWSPDGKRLASASYDRTLRIWDVEGGNEIKRLKGHGAAVTSVDWKSDGIHLASTSDDNTILIWDIRDEKAPLRSVLASVSDGRWIACEWLSQTCSYSDDGRWLRRVASDGSITPFLSSDTSAPLRLDINGFPANDKPLSVGDLTTLTLTVANRDGGGSLYGARLVARPVGGGEAAPIFNADAPTVVRLNPGETAGLRLDLLAAADYEAPEEADTRLLVQLVHSHGTQDIGTLPVRVTAPRLTLVNATPVDGMSSALNLSLRNDGGRATAPLLARAVLTGVNGEQPWQLAIDQTAERPPIAPGETVNLSLGLPTLPDGVRFDKHTQVALSLLSLGAPMHEWRLTAPLEVAGLIKRIHVNIGAGILGLLYLVYFFTVIRNPLVLAATDRPAGLLEIAPERLTALAWRLRWSLRLPGVLARAEVPPLRFAQATGFADRSADERARHLAARLELTLTGEGLSLSHGIRLYRAETPDRLPLNMPRLRLLMVPSTVPRDEILAALYQDADGRGIPALVISLDDGQRQALRDPAIDPDTMVAVPTGAELTSLLLGPQPLDVFARSVASQVSVTRISLYQRGGGVHDSAGFFGRDRELSHILNRDLANYFLIGSRQIGKSSLMKEIQRRGERRPDIDCRYLTLTGPDPRGPLARALGMDPAAPLDSVLDALPADGDRRRLILIDEADQFVAADAGHGYPVLSAFRRLSEEGRAFFILAGFWELHRVIAYDYQSPLRNFGEPLLLGGLDRQACLDLATRPMASLALSYASPDLPALIAERTGGRANLIAIVCAEILAELPPGERIITEQPVIDALNGGAVRDVLGGWGQLSGNDAERDNRLDRLIVYSTVAEESFTLSALQHRLHALGVSQGAEAIRQALNRLELAYIIVQGADGLYRYRVPVFTAMLRSLDLPLALSEEVGASASS